MTPSRLAVAALVGSLTLTLAACSDDHEPRPGPVAGTVTRGIDAAAYVEDYESDTLSDGAVNYSASGSSPGSATGFFLDRSALTAYPASSLGL